MLDWKVKSVMKILCCVSAVVITYYIKGRYNFAALKVEEPEMAAARLLTSEFEVFGRVQGESREVLTLSIV